MKHYRRSNFLTLDEYMARRNLPLASIVFRKFAYNGVVYDISENAHVGTNLCMIDALPEMHYANSVR